MSAKRVIVRLIHSIIHALALSVIGAAGVIFGLG